MKSGGNSFKMSRRKQQLGRKPSSSRRNASGRSSRSSMSSSTEVLPVSRVSSITEATPYGTSVGEVDPQQRASGSRSHHDSSRASSVFKHKLSMKLACVACVIGVPKGTKQEPEESREDDVYDDLSPSFVRNSQGKGSDRSAREDPSVPSRNKQPSAASLSKKVRFASNLSAYDEESRAKSLEHGKQEETENVEDEEIQLLTVLEDVEHWLGIHPKQ